ncbi:MAG: COQ9 family protein [Pseudomonadota bacterium]|nr:COQ9 family protein [Pseudomonadota bacterium]
MTKNGVPIRAALIKSALAHIPVDGWSLAALQSGARDIDLNGEVVAREFPRGVSDAIQCFSEQADRHMLQSMQALDLETFRIHERVGMAVENRLTYLEPHREAVHRGLTWLSMPQNVLLGARLLYRTVDDIWYGVGDRSTDFSFYTKRGLLAGVVGSTNLFWLEDRSKDGAETKAFLYRRLDEVMNIQTARKYMSVPRDRVLGSLSILKDVFERRYRRSDNGESRVT